MTKITIIGLHRVPCSDEDFEQAIADMWGEDLAGKRREDAVRRTREHFERLRLIEIETQPPTADIDWSEVTQPLPGVKRENWQVAYEEELVDAARGRWAFFLHYVEDSFPLLTPVGELTLPAISPLPLHLAYKKYLLPG